MRLQAGTRRAAPQDKKAVWLPSAQVGVDRPPRVPPSSRSEARTGAQTVSRRGRRQVLRETEREPPEQKGVWPEVTCGPCCGQGPTRRNSATWALDSGGPHRLRAPTMAARDGATGARPQAVPCAAPAMPSCGAETNQREGHHDLSSVRRDRRTRHVQTGPLSQLSQVSERTV